MTLIDNVFSAYKNKVQAFDKVETTTVALTNWINSKDGRGLVNAIINDPESIGRFTELFDHYCRTIHSSFAEQEVEDIKLPTFSSFLENAQDYNEKDDKPLNDELHVEETKLPTSEEQLNNDIEKAGNKPEEPDLEELIEEDVDESESGLTANFVELSAIKADKFDWYRFTGARKKKYTYGKSTWTLAPNGIVGISKACDFRNKHSLCILDQSKTHTIDLKKHQADLLRKRCKPFTGNIAGIVTPTPTSRRVATASNIDRIEDLYNITEEDGNYEFTPINVDKKVAKDQMVKYLSNLFNVEPIENGEDTHWDTNDGQIILKYQPDFKYVVSTRKK